MLLGGGLRSPSAFLVYNILHIKPYSSKYIANKMNENEICLFNLNRSHELSLGSIQKVQFSCYYHHLDNNLSAK